jgi:hypothetical protein
MKRRTLEAEERAQGATGEEAESGCGIPQPDRRRLQAIVLQSPPRQAEENEAGLPVPKLQRQATPEPTADSPAPRYAARANPWKNACKDLRKQVERLVKSPGAPLKSAPFHTASTLQLLGTGTEVLILISTPYWYGVETHEGQHGWMMRDQLELLP